MRDKSGDKFEGLADAILGVGRDNEREVGPDLGGGDFVDGGRQRRVAGVNGVGGGDDLALALLAIDDGEPRDGRRVRRGLGGGDGDEVFEDVASADARKLVSVADEKQMRARRDGLEERGGEPVIEHRGFVDDEEIGGEGCGFVGDEATAGGVVFKEAVDRSREAAGGLGETLRGAAGGSGEVDADLFGF